MNKAHQSNRVCNSLALLQCVASHQETRSLFLQAHIPIFLYPFLHTTLSKTRPFEYLRLTSLGVIGALVKVRLIFICSYVCLFFLSYVLRFITWRPMSKMWLRSCWALRSFRSAWKLWSREASCPRQWPLSSYRKSSPTTPVWPIFVRLMSDSRMLLRFSVLWCSI